MSASQKRPSPRDYRAARQEQLARERGKTLPYYARKVGKQLVTPGKRGRVTPSKKAR